jgi:predicted DNA-binding transcriptional regulator AlpA
VRASARALEIVPPAPVHRGRLIDAETVRAKIGGAKPPSLDWIRANVPGKRKYSHRCVRWYEDEVNAWLAKGIDAAPGE